MQQVVPPPATASHCPQMFSNKITASKRKFWYPALHRKANKLFVCHWVCVCVCASEYLCDCVSLAVYLCPHRSWCYLNGRLGLVLLGSLLWNLLLLRLLLLHHVYDTLPLTLSLCMWAWSLDNYQRSGRGSRKCRKSQGLVFIHRIGIGICGRFNMIFNDFAAVRLKHQWRVDTIGLDSIRFGWIGLIACCWFADTRALINI